MATLRVLAIDPGAVHCGMATFVGRNCVDAFEVGPAVCLTTTKHLLQTEALDVLVIEDFQLYAGKISEQIGSKLETVQLIGALKFVWTEWGEGVELVMQPASIKKPTLGMLRARGIKSVAKQKKAGGHALDAETHGWRWILEQESQEGGGSFYSDEQRQAIEEHRAWFDAEKRSRSAAVRGIK